MAIPFLHELETQALTLIKKIAEESEPVTMTQAEIICDHFNLNGEPRKKIISINESLIDVKIDAQTIERLSESESRNFYGIMNLLNGDRNGEQ